MKKTLFAASSLVLFCSVSAFANDEVACEDLINDSEIIVNVGKSVKELNGLLNSFKKIEIVDGQEVTTLKSADEVKGIVHTIAQTNIKLESEMKSISKLIDCRIAEGSSHKVENYQKILSSENKKIEIKSSKNEFTSKFVEVATAYKLQGQFFALESILNESMEFCDTKSFDKTEEAVDQLNQATGSMLFGFMKGKSKKVNEARSAISKNSKTAEKEFNSLMKTIECVDKENKSEILTNLTLENSEKEIEDKQIASFQRQQLENNLHDYKLTESKISPSAKDLKLLEEAYITEGKMRVFLDKVKGLDLKKESPYTPFNSVPVEETE